ncbi:hypothetical protein E2C01_048748 [Portunus trituberculatus]|uniref:Uncharacterized protein n=1 Tax=Portunus trituberculatus TaxID=210409 RepID=A0A5B7G4K2_PORTR|nr:hypothetical protein [Portunus trituberculatus]
MAGGGCRTHPLTQLRAPLAPLNPTASEPRPVSPLPASRRPLRTHTHPATLDLLSFFLPAFPTLLLLYDVSRGHLPNTLPTSP